MAIVRPEREVLSLAAALEMGSSHPLAKAILGRAVEQGVTIPAVSSAPAINGKGVVDTVNG